MGMAESLPMTLRSRRSGGLALLVAVLVVASCGSFTPTTAPATATSAATATTSPSLSAAPTTAPTKDLEAVYAEIEGQVIELRGLQPKAPVARNVLDEAGLRAFIAKRFSEETPEALIEASETLYKALLLMPQGASLEDLFVELYSTQAIGLYDSETKQLYVVARSGTFGPLDRITYAHEYVHALQDQAFDLQALIGDATDQTDRSLARTAAVEGDAYLTMGLWAQANLTAAEFAQVAALADPASEAALAKLPEIVKQTLLFPATSGIGLAIGDFSRGGFRAIDDRLANPPDSTEQILHADKLAAGERPVSVTLPDDLATKLGAGWKVSLQDTFGEMQLEILLREGGSGASVDAAAGWGGDRVALVEGPAGAVVAVVDTVWDSDADAAEFAAALDPLLEKLRAAGGSAAVLQPEPGRVVLVSGSSADVLGRVANALGLAE